jgi:hypothetical protein
MDLNKDLFGRLEKDLFLQTDSKKQYFENISLSSDIRSIGNVVNGFESVLNRNQIQIPYKINKDLHDINVNGFYGQCINQIIEGTSDITYTYNLTSLDDSDVLYTLFYNTILSEKRINDIGQEYPGYGKLMREFKNITYRDKTINASSERMELAELLIKLIQFPTNIDEELYEKFKTPIEKIKEYVKNHIGGVPSSKRQCENLADLITDIVLKYEHEEKEEDKKDKFLQWFTSEINDVQELYATFNPVMDLSSNDGFSEQLIQELEKIKYEEKGECEEHPVVFHHVTTLNQTLYEQCKKKFNLSKASTLSRLLARKNKDYQFSLKSMRTGRLDTNKLAEVKQNIPNVYERIGEVSTNKLCIGILVDESGSMGVIKYRKQEKL